MHNQLALLIISSGRFIYFTKLIESLRISKVSISDLKIYLMLNGEGIKRASLYQHVLQALDVDFEIKLIEGVKHSEIIKVGLRETIDYDFVLLCEDDWTFSKSLSMNDIARMKELSSSHRQVCFSNFARLHLIENGNIDQIYFTLNPSIISKIVRLRLLEEYDWFRDSSILDELEKNLSRTLGKTNGESHYLFDSDSFIVKHIGIFSTRHYLSLIRVFGPIGEQIIKVISYNRILAWCYRTTLKEVQKLLLLRSKFI